MTNVEDIKNRLNIIDIIGGYIKLQKAGKYWKAPCPFHKEKNPSFTVSPDRNMWHCFGCNQGGDIFSFVQKIENIEFPEALKILADRAGVQLTYEDSRVRSEKNQIFEILGEANNYFQDRLKENAEILNYLKDRGLTNESISKFQIGFAPEKYNNLSGHRSLYEYLIGRRFKKDLIEQAGLLVNSLSENQESRGAIIYDKFRNRITFPIFDNSGRITGFTGRIYPPDRDDKFGPKYLNSPQTAVFDKSRILYGLNFAKSEIIKKDFVLLVEGQMDLIAAHQDGVVNSVAVSGTALTDEHLNTLKRYTDNIVFGFDMDEAGFDATERSVNLALQHGFNVKIINISYGKDIADLVQHTPKELVKIIDKRIPFIEYYVKGVLEKYPPTDLENKKKATKLVLSKIILIPNAIERAHWLEILSKKLNTPIPYLEEELSKIRGSHKDGTGGKSEETGVQKPKIDILTEKALALFLKSDFNEQEFISYLPYFSLIYTELLDLIKKQGRDIKVEPESQIDKLLNYIQMLGDYEIEHSDYLKIKSDIEHEIRYILLRLKEDFLRSKLKLLTEKIKSNEVSGSANEQEIKNLLQEFSQLSDELTKTITSHV